MGSITFSVSFCSLRFVQSPVPLSLSQGYLPPLHSRAFPLTETLLRSPSVVFGFQMLLSSKDHSEVDPEFSFSPSQLLLVRSSVSLLGGHTYSQDRFVGVPGRLLLIFGPPPYYRAGPWSLCSSFVTALPMPSWIHQRGSLRAKAYASNVPGTVAQVSQSKDRTFLLGLWIWDRVFCSPRRPVARLCEDQRSNS